jgi:hypothetical protein
MAKHALREMSSTSNPPRARLKTKNNVTSGKLMWLFVLFKAETSFGRIVKTAVCAAAAVAFYLGLTAAPQASVQVVLSLAVIAALWVHGYLESRRLSYASAQCDAEIYEGEGRIRVAGAGVDFVLHLASRTLTVNKVAKRFVSTDAPGEFQRLRSGRFEWPFRARAVEDQPYNGTARAVRAVSGISERWAGEAARSAAASASTSAIDANNGATTVPSTGESELGVYWMHPGQGYRLMFSVTGPAEKYEAIERAFLIYSAWIENEDEARRAIERRHQAEAWQRDWEAKRLAEELDHERRRGGAAIDETDPHLRVTAKAMMSSRRW